MSTLTDMLTRDIADIDPTTEAGAEENEPSRGEKRRHSNPESDPATSGLCVECEDQPAAVVCRECDDTLCDVCFHALHRRGKRQRHEVNRITSAPDATVVAAAQTDAVVVPTAPAAGDATSPLAMDTGHEARASSDLDLSSDDDAHADDDDARRPVAIESISTDVGRAGQPLTVFERAKYIPLRLDMSERKALRLLEAALNVSEYTDHVDVYCYGSKMKRIQTQLLDMCAIMSGLMVASDYKAGQELISTREFQENEIFFQVCLQGYNYQSSFFPSSSSLFLLIRNSLKWDDVTKS